MKKEDISGIVAYLIIMAIAIIYGLTVLRSHGSQSGLSTGAYIGYVIGAIVAGIVFNAVIFELAHVVGAKIGKYNILSVCILGFLFEKVNKKTRVRWASFDGLTGETKIMPREVKENEKQSNPTPYLMFGTVFFAVELLVFVILFISLNKIPNNKDASNAGYFLLTMLVIGGMIWIYNILPFRVDTMTDGYRLRMVGNPKNKEAFNELLRVEHEVSEGNKNVEIKVFTEITNFTAELNLNKVYVLLDNEKYEEAEKLLDIILNGGNDLSPKTYLRAKAQKIYINIITKPLEDAKVYYEKEVPASDRRDISKDISMPSIRTYILMSALLDKSRSETLLTLKNVYNAYKRTPTKRKETEAKLFNNALDLAIKAHPDWELEDYRLVIEKEKNKEK